tara:strand:+ start:1107 stop:1556 length:450 start_codon:yes stop_codon:yes gene_type:complete
MVNGIIKGKTSDTAAKATVTNSTDNTDFPVVFNDESDRLLDDTGSFTYNPSNGNLTLAVGHIITDNKIGTSATGEYINFGTSTEVNIFVSNTERLSVTDTGVDIKGNSSISGNVIMMSNLPTSDPSSTGQLWNSSGTLMISTGGSPPPA